MRATRSSKTQGTTYPATQIKSQETGSLIKFLLLLYRSLLSLNLATYYVLKYSHDQHKQINSHETLSRRTTLCEHVVFIKAKLTPRYTSFIQNPMASQLIKVFHAYCGKGSSITVETKAPQHTLPCATSIQSTTLSSWDFRLILFQKFSFPARISRVPPYFLAFTNHFCCLYHTKEQIFGVLWTFPQHGSSISGERLLSSSTHHKLGNQHCTPTGVRTLKICADTLHITQLNMCTCYNQTPKSGYWWDYADNAVNSQAHRINNKRSDRC